MHTARRHNPRWPALAAGALAATLAAVITAAEPAAATIPGCLAAPVSGIAATPDGGGYWEVARDGGVFTFGTAHFYGAMAGKPLNKPIVALVPTATGRGYWEVGTDGGVFAFGDAVSPANNPLPAMKLNGPVVGAARSGAQGLQLVGSDGGVFSLGGAPSLGGMAGRPLNKPISAIVTTQSGRGYWLIGGDGGVFNFGDAQLPAANPLPGMRLNGPIVGAARVGAQGLQLVGSDGGVFSLGGAANYGSAGGLHLAAPVAGVAAAADGKGYWLDAADGGLFAYGPSAPFLGNAVSTGCATTPPPASGNAIVQAATTLLNGGSGPGWPGGSIPYSWGGGHAIAVGPSLGTCVGYSGSVTPCPARSTKGLDCSGFARMVYMIAFGRDVLGSGTTDDELRRMVKVSTPQPGDLAFFGTVGNGAYATHHVGVYIGNGTLINERATGNFVEKTPVSHFTDLVGYWHLAR